MWIYFTRFNENDRKHLTQSKLNWSKSVNKSRGFIAGQKRLTMKKNHEYAYSMLNTNDLAHWYTHIHKPNLRSKDCISNVSPRSVNTVLTQAMIKITPLFYNPGLFTSHGLCALDFMRFYDFTISMVIQNVMFAVCTYIIWSKSSICSRSVSKSG